MKDIPAFPVFPETGGGHASAFQGMTLRDYFAAKAMQGFLSCVYDEIEPSESQGFAVVCYALADEMMKAREA